MHGAIHLMNLKGAVGFGAFARGNGQPILNIDRTDAEHLSVGDDLAFDIGDQIVLRGDSARFQRAGKGAG